MITKEQKKVVVAELADMLREATSLYFVDFTGMTVATDQAFRNELRKKGVTMRVAKNTLIIRALADVGGYDIEDSKFAGQTAVIFGGADPIAPAKIIRQYFEKGEKPKLKVAVVEGQVFDGTQLKQVSELPTREDLISAMIGSIHAPISGIVGSINAVMRDVASLVEEVAKKKAA
ncbi:MAG: 50S ribosomal protein L10 [Ignavibacteria bacterium]|nr:50S ribosomal protein L10 [Ignavibacteria bacterium]MBP6508965.1 50S ribosomal protein L10 [Candidatus Kapabacteria bacterium]MBK6419425.1 50S ribosomal protein L10 [Ignavibacteria bacterium]MBK6759946.1 50S ribosomal protein L10 [Ignavibacteria bacterium]MBK7032859.1 50S ribosomal protein L10 [Ignavibacteria bacterium]